MAGTDPDVFTNNYIKVNNLKIINKPNYDSTFDKHVIPIIKNLLWYNNNIGLDLIKHKEEPNYEFNVMIISDHNFIKEKYKMNIPNGSAYIQQHTYYKVASQEADIIAYHYTKDLQVPYISYVNRVL